MIRVRSILYISKGMFRDSCLVMGELLLYFWGFLGLIGTTEILSINAD